MWLYYFYRYALTLTVPLIYFVLSKRIKRGKEIKSRIHEKTGYSDIKQDTDSVIWIHAVSVGEVRAAISFIQALRENGYAEASILLTYTTTTAAALIKNTKFSPAIFHVFLPFDVVSWIRLFLKIWNPSVGFFIESEIWPNLLTEMKRLHIPAVLISARLSEKTYGRLKKYPTLSQYLFSLYQGIYPVDEPIKKRLAIFNAPVKNYIQLKYTSDRLPYTLKNDEKIKQIIENRPVFCVASTNESDESLILKTHIALKKRFSNIITLYIPRHLTRVPAIQKQTALYRTIIYSDFVAQDEGDGQGDDTKKIEICLVDQLNVLGAIYRNVPTVYLGGGFSDNGGHNPLEALRYNCITIIGPNYTNHKSIVRKLINTPILKIIHTQDELPTLWVSLMQASKVSYTAYIPDSKQYRKHVVTLMKPYLSKHAYT